MILIEPPANFSSRSCLYCAAVYVYIHCACTLYCGIVYLIAKVQWLWNDFLSRSQLSCGQLPCGQLSRGQLVTRSTLHLKCWQKLSLCPIRECSDDCLQCPGPCMERRASTTEFIAEDISIHDPNTPEVKPTSVTFERLFISEWSCGVVCVYMCKRCIRVKGVYV